MIDQRTVTRDAVIRPWRLKTDRLIADRLSDARSHAQAGRREDADRRLDELSVGLQNHLSDARADFYRQSFTVHRPYLDPAIHDFELEPNLDGELVARRTRITGRDHAQDIASAVQDARARMRLAARQKQAEQHLKIWELSERARLGQRVRGALSDSQIALHEAIGHLLVRPEYR